MGDIWPFCFARGVEGEGGWGCSVWCSDRKFGLDHLIEFQSHIL